MPKRHLARNRIILTLGRKACDVLASKPAGTPTHKTTKNLLLLALMKFLAMKEGIWSMKETSGNEFSPPEERRVLHSQHTGVLLTAELFWGLP